MSKFQSYLIHWKNFLALHGFAGLLAGQAASLLFQSSWPAAPITGLIIGLLLACYRAFKAPGDLTDWQIAQLRGVISPFDPDRIEPDSYDVLLGNQFTRVLPDGEEESWAANETVILPGECLLAHTQETFKFPKNLKGILQGKSSWARLSLFVECAGLFDKGFEGTAVLELYNASPHKILLKAGDRIAQMSFHRTLPATLPYGNKERESHYQGQTGARASWLTKKERIQN